MSKSRGGVIAGGILLVLFCAAMILLGDVSVKNIEYNSWDINYFSGRAVAEYNFSEIEMDDSFHNATKAHWGHMPLSYKIGENCNSEQTKRVTSAFNRLWTETNGAVSFVKAVGNTTDLEVGCKLRGQEKIFGRLFLEGQAQYFVYDKTIVRAIVTLYVSNETGVVDKCANIDDVSLHEILHVFGVGHSIGVGELMSPVRGDCPEVFPKDVAEELKDIYSR